MQAFDNGAGGLRLSGGSTLTGSVNYTTRTIVFDPSVLVSVPKPKYDNVIIGSVPGGDIINGGHPSTTDTYRYQMTGYDMLQLVAVLPTDAPITVRWRTNAGSSATSETFRIDALTYDLTPGFAETIVQGSVRFVCGGKTYIDRLGTLYNNIDPRTGAGVLAGEVAYQTGAVTVRDWTPGAANTLTLQSLVTEINVQPVDQVVFRVPIAPVRTGSMQIRAVPVEGNGGAQVNVTADATGKILSPWMTGSIDYESGVVRIRFGQVVTVTPQVQAEPWFNADAVYTENSVQKVLKPRPVFADSIRYNAVGYTYLPLSSDILGLDPVRLPSDGRVPIYRTGDVVVVNHTAHDTLPQAMVGAVFDVGRERVSYIKVFDAAGKALPDIMYKTDPDAGTVTLTADFSLTGLTLPLHAEHRIEDMAVVTDVQINGRLALNKPLTHNYPAHDTLVSSALIAGDLQARVYGKFSQATWTNEWSDSLIGDTTTSQYNDKLYPITTTNRGAVQEQWALIFTSSTAFRVVGRSVGQIATGNTSTDLAPINPATNAPYFELKAMGWGDGWAAGNVFRHNTAAANYPGWLIRTVLQGPVTAEDDSFQVQARGDLDR